MIAMCDWLPLIHTALTGVLALAGIVLGARIGRGR